MPRVPRAGVAIAGGGVTNGGGTGGFFTPGSVCDPGFTISMVGLVTRWTPVKNLSFAVEALYAYLKTNMSGGAVPVVAATGGPTGPSSSLVLPTPVCALLFLPVNLTTSATTVQPRSASAFSATSDPIA